MCLSVTSPLLLVPEACTPRLPIMTKAMINMELVRRRTWIFFDIRPTFIFLIETKNACKVSYQYYSYLFWMQLSFPTEQENLRSLAPMQFIPTKNEVSVHFAV